VSFSGEDDINHMRKHEGYEEIHHETSPNETIQIPQTPQAEVLKKRGRPRKEVMEI
jgi:hypothetical protein